MVGNHRRSSFKFPSVDIACNSLTVGVSLVLCYFFVLHPVKVQAKAPNTRTNTDKFGQEKENILQNHQNLVEWIYKILDNDNVICEK